MNVVVLKSEPECWSQIGVLKERKRKYFSRKLSTLSGELSNLY